MFQMFCCFCFHCRTGTNQRTSQILMPRSPMTGMMRWMASGSHRWSRTLNTRCISSDSNSSCSQDLFCAIFLSFAHQRALQKYLLCFHCQPLCVLTPVSLCVCCPQGEWKPREIDNPAYKGKWIHPEIDNPEYTADSEIYKYGSVGVIGLDLWQVSWMCICILMHNEIY